MEIELNSQLRIVESKLKNVKEQMKVLREEERSLLSERTELESTLRDCQKSENSALKENWVRDDFPWSEKVRGLLAKFNISEFRPLQLECINAVLSGHDSLLVMPTGGGKSLCYQIPALARPGFCLVVSPLVSLMEDQTLGLASLGVAARLLCSDTPREEAALVHRLLADPASQLKVLFVTPERIGRSKRFISSLERAHERSLLSIIVIDEVHCASQWGHDFRPDYKKLCLFKLQFPSVPLLGLTATATPQVLSDVREILRLPSPVELRAGSNRPNLFYEVRLKPDQFSEQAAGIAALLTREFSGQSGIIYCLSKKDCEQLAAKLVENGLSAASYHADVPAARRREVHHCWLNGDILIVVSTVAFGLGIDKKNVRFVIHHSLAKSIENYYQECGRAGRDGRPARCVLFYRPRDYFSHSGMVLTEKTGIRNLNAMSRYCLEGSVCRRSLMARHFLEKFSSEDCSGMCDNCLVSQQMPYDPVRSDSRDIYKSLINLLDSASVRKERLTAAKLVTLWRQTRPKDREVSNFACMCLIMHGLFDGIFREDYHFTPYNTISYIVVGPFANTLPSDASPLAAVNVSNIEFREKMGDKLAQLIKTSFSNFDSNSLFASKFLKPVEPVISLIDTDSDSGEDCTFQPKKFCSGQESDQYYVD